MVLQQALSKASFRAEVTARNEELGASKLFAITTAACAETVIENSRGRDRKETANFRKVAIQSTDLHLPSVGVDSLSFILRHSQRKISYIKYLSSQNTQNGRIRIEYRIELCRTKFLFLGSSLLPFSLSLRSSELFYFNVAKWYNLRKTSNLNPYIVPEHLRRSRKAKHDDLTSLKLRKASQ